MQTAQTVSDTRLPVSVRHFRGRMAAAGPKADNLIGHRPARRFRMAPA